MMQLAPPSASRLREIAERAGLNLELAHLLGPKSQISRRQAEMLREELVRPLNQSPFRSIGEETFERFIEDVFFPIKLDTGEWRENTAKKSMREIRKHIVAELGEVRFEELTTALLRALLKKKTE
jgi:hypothetical protein